MMRTILAPVVLAGLLALLTTSQAHAYGCAHVGYTRVSPNGGVEHYGATETRTPYGSEDVHTDRYGGAYGGGESTTRAYSPSMYSGYGAVGVHTTADQGSVTRSVTRYP